MKLVHLLIVATATLSGCDALVLSEAAFRDRVVSAIEKRGVDLEIEITGPLALSHKDGVMNLETGYDEYRRNPADLDLIIEKWVGIVEASRDDTTPDIRTSIVYVVRNQVYATPPQAPAGQRPTLVSRPLAGDLMAVLMVDYPQALKTVSPGDLEEVGLSMDDAWRLAAENLKTKIGPVGVGDLNGNGPLSVTAASGLATGLLADPGVCEPSGMFGDGSIVLVLDRDTFISAMPSDPASVRRFWTFARPYLGTAELASDTPIACKNGKWDLAPIPK